MYLLFETCATQYVEANETNINLDTNVSVFKTLDELKERAVYSLKLMFEDTYSELSELELIDLAEEEFIEERLKKVNFYEVEEDRFSTNSDDCYLYTYNNIDSQLGPVAYEAKVVKVKA